MIELKNKNIVTDILALVYKAKININVAKNSGDMAGTCICPNCGMMSLEYYYDGDNSLGECDNCNFKI